MARGTIAKSALFLAVLAGVLFMSRAGAFSGVRGALAGAAGSLLGGAWRAADGAVSRIGGGAAVRIRELERERVLLLGEIARFEYLRSENETLRQALLLKQNGEPGTLVAPVRAFFREGQNEYLMIGKGFGDGVGIGDLVLSRERVFGGVVVETGTHVSRAELLTSADRRTDVTVSGTVRAIAQGSTSREFSIELVPQDADVKRGDLVVASNRITGRERALVIGEVRDVRQSEHQVFKTVNAAHLFDPAADEVLVIPAP